MGVRLPRIDRGLPLKNCDLPNVINRISMAVEALHNIKGSDGVSVSVTSQGVRIRNKNNTNSSGGGGGKSSKAKPNAFPVCITGKQGGYYSIDIYANGRGNTKTGVGVMQVTMSNIGSDIPTGTWMMGFTNSVKITGGSQST